MKFKLYLKQKGEGCDYMIGCGERMIDLKAETKEAAVKEAKQEIDDHTHSECEIKEALLIEAFDDLSRLSQEVKSDREVAKTRAIIEEKRKQYQKLKEELGED